ncbi:DUF1516 family protein (plasmid) [Niallia circulans]|uniref:DUF1516 family protein n=1 Tax=Niallia circulans TaxID=1397 RepID=A0A553SQX8_NIACI|nr:MULTISPECIES: DUF1516 family protein [Niallia]MCM3216655.1 DUF1516 family protein [Niallia taxi]TRZ39395.1 DUF1516 family protein [Niallia circulans]
MNFFQNNVNIFSGMHQGSWALLFILFFVTYFLYIKTKNRLATIMHMILRLFYVIMLFSGAGLVIAYDYVTFYVIKGIIAVIMVALMEISCVRAKKGKNNLYAFYSGSALLIVVVLMGFRVISF